MSAIKAWAMKRADGEIVLVSINPFRLEQIPPEHSCVQVQITELGEGAIEQDLAMMLRRMIWQINKMDGDSSLKVLAGNALQLLKKYRLEGSPLRSGA